MFSADVKMDPWNEFGWELDVGVEVSKLACDLQELLIAERIGRTADGLL